MRLTRAHWLLAAATILCLVIAGIVMALTPNTWKPRIEEQLSAKLGLKTIINGDITVRLRPSPSVTVADALAVGGTDVMIRLGEVRADLSGAALWRRLIQIEHLTIKNADVQWTDGVSLTPPADASGAVAGSSSSTPASGTASAGSGSGPTPGVIVPVGGGFSWTIAEGARVTVEGSRLTLRATDGRKTFSAEDVALSGQWRSAEGPSIGPGNHTRIDGTITAASVTTGTMPVTAFKAQLVVDRQVITIDPVAFAAYGGLAHARLTMDTGASPIAISLDGRLADLTIEDLMRQWYGQSVMSGTAGGTIKLAVRGTEPSELRASANGQVSLEANQILVRGYDLDGSLERYAKTQEFDLVDLGCFVIAGPFGAAFSKVFDAVNAYKGSSGEHTEIMQIISAWDLADGIATARDVGFATPKNRLALTGKLDIEGHKFVDVTIGVVDEDGCVKFGERIQGTFEKPEIRRANFVARTVAAPMVSLFRRARNIVRSKPECVPFYTGAIPHPLESGPD